MSPDPWPASIARTRYYRSLPDGLLAIVAIIHRAQQLTARSSRLPRTRVCVGSA